jgi:RNA polymerase sigma factor for flagellar operon FliA
VREMLMTASKRVATETETSSHREKLILEHLPQVQLIARRIRRNLPSSVDLDDLISSGIVGLIAAIDHYDAKQNVKLKTYAEYKIRGAMLDNLRALDWTRRDHRKRSRLIEAATRDLVKEHCRTPEHEEIATRIGLTLEQYQKWLNDAPPIQVEYEDALLRCISGEQSQSELFERDELRRLLGKCIKKLSPVERAVLNLYCYEGWTLLEIAEKIDVHQWRISQLKSQAISRLRCVLQALWRPERRASCS